MGMGVGCYRSNMMYTQSWYAMPLGDTWGWNGDGGGVGGYRSKIDVLYTHSWYTIYVTWARENQVVTETLACCSFKRNQSIDDMLAPNATNVGTQFHALGTGSFQVGLPAIVLNGQQKILTTHPKTSKDAIVPWLTTWFLLRHANYCVTGPLAWPCWRLCCSNLRLSCTIRRVQLTNFLGCFEPEPKAVFVQGLCWAYGGLWWAQKKNPTNLEQVNQPWTSESFTTNQWITKSEA